MKQLRTLIAAAAAALLSATAVQAQTTPATGFPATDPPASMRDSTGPANSDRNNGSAAPTGTQDAAPQATQDVAPRTAPADTATISPQEQLRNDRTAARTEMKRAGGEAAAAQRAAMAERGAQGEMSTPQQDRGGLSGLGSESWPENNPGRSQ